MNEVTVSTFLFICVSHRKERANQRLLYSLIACCLRAIRTGVSVPTGPGWPVVPNPASVSGHTFLLHEPAAFRSGGGTWEALLGSQVGAGFSRNSGLSCQLASKSSYWIFICLSVTCGLLGTGTTVDVNHVSADGVPFVAESRQREYSPALELPLPLSCSNLGVKKLICRPSALQCSAFSVSAISFPFCGQALLALECPFLLPQGRTAFLC